MPDQKKISDVPGTFVRTYRIAALRLFFVVAIPLIIVARSAWAGFPWIFTILHLAGIGLVIAAVLGRFWSILYIGGRKQSMIMQDGPYSICRHPLYLFSSLGAIGFGLLLGSVLLAALFGGVVFYILSATAAQEEEMLRHTFGDQYDAYEDRVPAIVPRPSLYRTEPLITVDTAHLRGNFFDALVFLALIPIAEIVRTLQITGAVWTFPLI